MNEAASRPGTRDIVVEEVLPHAPETVWRALTTGALIARWLMAPSGFEAVPGTDFTFQTKPAGAWDGVIHCRVLEVLAQERLAYAWRSGDAGNVGYGSRLDTVVTFDLTAVEGGTRLRLVHGGFVTPTNDSAFQSMGAAWPKVLASIGTIAASGNELANSGSGT